MPFLSWTDGSPPSKKERRKAYVAEDLVFGGCLREGMKR